LDKPQYLAIFRRTGNVWVTSRNNSSLVELDGNDLHVISTMLVDSPNGIAIWQDKGLAYVTNQDNNTVTEIDLVAHKITRKIDVGQQPFGITVEQTTGDVFVANNGSNDVSCIPSNGAPVTSTNNPQVPLDRPTRLIGYRYSDQIPGAALVVDSSGLVAIVAISNPSSGLADTIKPAAAIINACVIAKVAQINKDALADIDQSSSTDPVTFYVTDIDGKSVVLILGTFLSNRTNSVTSAYPTITLPKAPYAVANFDKCVGAVVPSQNRLYIISQDLKQILGQKKTGKQGDNGGWGLAYNPDNNTAYVANPDSNSVMRFETPCQ
jgi:YVTN family beta-propeller protein